LVVGRRADVVVGYDYEAVALCLNSAFTSSMMNPVMATMTNTLARPRVNFLEFMSFLSF